MKSIERRFNKIEEKNPDWGSYVCFAEAVKSQNFSVSAIHRWFNKLVNASDYFAHEKTAILEHLTSITKRDGADGSGD